MLKATMITTAAAFLALTGAGCGSGVDDSGTSGGGGGAASASQGLPHGHAPFPIDPSQFTTTIDNPYWPMAPGDHWVYREVENGERQRVDVTVTDRTKAVADGVEARVVHDVVSRRGELVEDTFDWYAQAADGTLWYFGEDTTEYENGKPKTTGGSWEAGVDDAEPGVIMPASPQTGMSYREEYYANEAEDAARITGTDASTTVPYGQFQHVVTTENTSPLEPNVVEHKWYARGVGPVREALVSGGTGDTVLLRLTHGG
jgi:hypothetical protein